MTAAKKPSASKKATSKSAAKKSPKKTVAKKTAAKQAAKKAPAKKTAAGGAAKKTAKKAAPKATAKTAAKTTPKATAKKTPARSGGRTASKPTVRSSSSASRRVATKAPPKPSRPVRPAKFDKKQLAAIREGLETKRAELQQRQAELEEDSFDGTQSDITGEVGLDEDFADAGTATFERERDLSIRNNITDLIDQMTRAIARIDEGSYGTCERCGRPIDAARLRELPHALLCLDCKRREERAR
ncbi:MAG TPA: TraR/DksA C4-type zinc finger protein [Actinomycetota bacterium]|jgi:RNA polymerase-binding protein DksA